MKHKPKAIILGGTIPHLALIENLKQRGYYTILVDYYENPPAKRVADEHIRESTLDKERVLEIAKKTKASLVITTCIDQANVTACYVAEKLALPMPYSYGTALNVTNKVLMKRIMINNEIPTSKYVQVHDIKDFNNHGLKYPVVVKPSDSNGSKGVKKAYNSNDLRIFLEQALNISRGHEAIIEEYNEGKEIGIDCFVENQEVTILTARLRRKIMIDSNPLQQIYGTISPADISEKNYGDLKEIANKIAKAFNLSNTPLMIQVIIKNDEINVIEFAPRIGGGESFRIVELSTGFNIIDAAVDSFLGVRVSVDCKLPTTYIAETLIYVQPSVFGCITGYQDLIDNGTIEYLVSYKTKGMNINSDLSSINRVGAFAVKADNKSDIDKKITNVVKSLEVYDIYGKPVMRKDIY